MSDTKVDCVVVGGGPAGLSAAIYLARFHLSVELFDTDDSRAAWIPRTHNHPGFPDGIAGRDLLDRMRAQAEQFGARRRMAEVTRLVPGDGGFEVQAGASSVWARAVLLATGVVNRQPMVADDGHDAALASGRLRYCPICDGYEVTDRRIGVLGSGEHGTSEALFLRGYSADVTLISVDGPHALDDRCRDQLQDAGVALRDGPAAPLRLDSDGIVAALPEDVLRFDTIYPALGSDIRSALAVAAGADASDGGCLDVDAHQRTSVANLWAAGDVVMGLDQISTAMGQATVAATAIRNALSDQTPLRR